MKIRIVKCSSEHYWYNNHIGKELNVIDGLIDEMGYCVAKGRVTNSYVALEDAVIIVPLNCQVCGREYWDTEPKMCCSGRDCGCMGQPIEPRVCSEDCYNNLPGIRKTSSDDSVMATAVALYAEQASEKLDKDMLKDPERGITITKARQFGDAGRVSDYMEKTLKALPDFLKAESGRFTDPGPHTNNMPKFENPPQIPNRMKLPMEGRDLNLPDEDGWWLY